MADDLRCCWCGRPFRARQSGGKPQRFCRPACRRAFHAAARTWVLDVVAAGLLSVTDLKDRAGLTRALLRLAALSAPVDHLAAVERRPENRRTGQETLEHAMQRAIAARRR
jgi:hypothetical protein